MGIITSVVLIVLGILGASSIIIKKKPEAEDLIKKIVPFQGWIGFISALWGIWWIINSFMRVGWLAVGSVYLLIFWIIYLASGICLAGLGIILGYGLINQYMLSKAPEDAKKKAEELRQKLVSIQIPLGIFSICLGIFSLIWGFLPGF